MTLGEDVFCAPSLLFASLTLSESCGSRDEAGFCAIGDLELREDGRDVVANGLERKREPCQSRPEAVV